MINLLLLLWHNLGIQARQLRQILIHVKLKLGVDLHLVIGKKRELHGTLSRVLETDKLISVCRASIVSEKV